MEQSPGGETVLHLPGGHQSLGSDRGQQRQPQPQRAARMLCLQPCSSDECGGPGLPHLGAGLPEQETLLHPYSPAQPAVGGPGGADGPRADGPQAQGWRG